MTTFTDFKNSRRHVDDLEGALGISIYCDPGIKCPGLVYLDSYYIEERCDNWPDAAKAEGKYLLIIGNSEWLSDDLDDLEQKLWDFFVREERS